MISGTVTGDREIAARFEQIPAQVRANLRTRIQRAIIRLQRYVVTQKLQDQVLNVRSGTLQRSIDKVMREDPASVTGVVWTNVKYARRHEYGFQGSESVRAHLRMMTQAFGRPVKEPRKIAVREFTRSVNYPEHSFLRSALRDMAPEIMAQLEQAVTEALH